MKKSISFNQLIRYIFTILLLIIFLRKGKAIFVNSTSNSSSSTKIPDFSDDEKILKIFQDHGFRNAKLFRPSQIREMMGVMDSFENEYRLLEKKISDDNLIKDFTREHISNIAIRLQRLEAEALKGIYPRSFMLKLYNLKCKFFFIEERLAEKYKIPSTWRYYQIYKNKFEYIKRNIEENSFGSEYITLKQKTLRCISDAHTKISRIILQRLRKIEPIPGTYGSWHAAISIFLLSGLTYLFYKFNPWRKEGKNAQEIKCIKNFFNRSRLDIKRGNIRVWFKSITLETICKTIWFNNKVQQHKSIRPGSDYMLLPNKKLFLIILADSNHIGFSVIAKKYKQQEFQVTRNELQRRLNKIWNNFSRYIGGELFKTCNIVIKDDAIIEIESKIVAKFPNFFRKAKKVCSFVRLERDKLIFEIAKIESLTTIDSITKPIADFFKQVDKNGLSSYRFSIEKCNKLYSQIIDVLSNGVSKDLTKKFKIKIVEFSAHIDFKEYKKFLRSYISNMKKNQAIIDQKTLTEQLNFFKKSAMLLVQDGIKGQPEKFLQKIKNSLQVLKNNLEGGIFKKHFKPLLENFKAVLERINVWSFGFVVHYKRLGAQLFRFKIIADFNNTKCLTCYSKLFSDCFHEFGLIIMEGVNLKYQIKKLLINLDLEHLANKNLLKPFAEKTRNYASYLKKQGTELQKKVKRLKQKNNSSFQSRKQLACNGKLKRPVKPKLMLPSSKDIKKLSGNISLSSGQVFKTFFKKPRKPVSKNTATESSKLNLHRDLLSFLKTTQKKVVNSKYARYIYIGNIIIVYARVSHYSRGILVNAGEQKHKLNKLIEALREIRDVIWHDFENLHVNLLGAYDSFFEALIDFFKINNFKNKAKSFNFFSNRIKDGSISNISGPEIIKELFSVLTDLEISRDISKVNRQLVLQIVLSALGVLLKKHETEFYLSNPLLCDLMNECRHKLDSAQLLSISSLNAIFKLLASVSLFREHMGRNNLAGNFNFSDVKILLSEFASSEFMNVKYNINNIITFMSPLTLLTSDVSQNEEVMRSYYQLSQLFASYNHINGKKVYLAVKLPINSSKVGGNKLGCLFSFYHDGVVVCEFFLTKTLVKFWGLFGATRFALMNYYKKFTGKDLHIMTHTENDDGVDKACINICYNVNYYLQKQRESDNVGSGLTHWGQGGKLSW